ncbi:hypothetical protein [Embleya hyalina]|uniref:Uncharacterized protein n=1 Tax=Embleya hyalina TaxID=516124 RepID=A0A401Z561_9ACTN|nr:hypothetical protein [Embleya hyalina]GCE01968.1 hypothetical protein EHYA_09743 [Embleya hyalina]
MTRRHVAVRPPRAGSRDTRRRGAHPSARTSRFRRNGWLGALLAVALALLGALAAPASARAAGAPDPDRTASVSAHTVADPGHVRDVADEATRDVRRGPPAPLAARDLHDERHHLHHPHDAALTGRAVALPPPAGHRTSALGADADPSPRRFVLPPGRAPPSPRAPDLP